MPVSSIAQILLRVIALNWILSGIIQFCFSFYPYEYQGMAFPQVLPWLLYSFLGVAVWWLAPKLAKLAAHRNDGDFTLEGVTLEQLYATALMALGAYVALTNLPSALIGLKFYAGTRSDVLGTGPNANYYEFLRPLASAVLGIALVAAARKLAAKLCADKPAAERKD